MATLVRLVGVITTAMALAPYGASALSLRRLEYQGIMVTPNCFVENGYDYVGHDLTSIPGSYDQCCGKCASTSGCKAWSWSDYNGGTCWLKWGRGEIIVNANVKSAIVLYSTPQYCQLQNDFDYVDNDIARVDGAKAEDCCDACQKYPGCRAYSWSDFQGGSCWLKSKVTQTVFKPGVKSAIAYPDQDQVPLCPNFEYDIDFVDNDLGNWPAPKANLCCDMCKMTNGCKAFSWSVHNGGTCWLKTQKGQAIWATGVISAQLFPNPPPQCTIEYDVDYFDHDIGNRLAFKAELCCDICKATTGCKAFSWSDFNGGTCWLKSAKGAVVAKSGVKSATV